jgi:hypothetical protein
MTRAVHYETAMRERAKREKKFLVTINVDGREAGDDSCTVQRLADLDTAQHLTKLAVELLKPRHASHDGGKGPIPKLSATERKA